MCQNHNYTLRLIWSCVKQITQMKRTKYKHKATSTVQAKGIKGLKKRVVLRKRLHRHISFYCPLLYCVFYKLKVCGNPVSSKSIGAIFPTAFAHFMTLSHLVILTMFQTFSLLLYLLCDL